MTKVKLYTEDQVKKAIESARENSFGSDFQRWLTKSEESIMKGLTPIELPSDEEIKEQPKYWGRLYKVGFVDGKKWFYQYLHDKILQGGKK